jgi:periplasmic protein TonB
MAQSALSPLVPAPRWRNATSAAAPPLVFTERDSLARGRGVSAFSSLAVHAVLLSIVLLVPLLSDEIPPAADRGVRAFFVTPTDVVAPPPPPPPPPVSAARRLTRAPAVARAAEPARFVAPVEIPDRVVPEASLDFGVEGGVAGGVEGGVPGGVIGGIVGGLPREAPAAPPTPVVRIGGKVVAPKRVHGVPPTYPELAVISGVAGVVVVDAHVDVQGRVKSATFVSGNPLFEQAAVEAVRQWRYQPLLLNGIPCEFMLIVTMNFSLQRH